MKILIVEDDIKLCESLEKAFVSSGYKVNVCHSVEEVIGHNFALDHDLIVLDLMLQGKSGDHLVNALRKKSSSIPVLILSGRSDTQVKIDLLNMGVDDFITKPFDMSELLARIKAVYRRYLEKEYKDQENYGDISFYWKQNKIVRSGKTINLTQKEGSLLKFLLQNRNRTVRNEDILSKVWEARVGFHSNVIQSTVRRLRKKIDTGFDHKLIRNVHGVGYTLVLPEQD